MTPAPPSTPGPAVLTGHTPSGTAYVMLPPAAKPPAPTLLLFAMAGAETLTHESFNRVGRLLHGQGWNVVSLDLPCHGADNRPGEPPALAGWAARLAAGEDIVAAFRARIADLADHLAAAGVADPARLAAAGVSRGGFLAFQAAAAVPRLRAVAAFAPVTDLAAVSECAGLRDNPLLRRLALVQVADTLADRHAWITMGNADDRVDTARAMAFSQALAQAARRRGLPPQVTLHVLPTPGHQSFPAWHDDAAGWLQECVETRGPKGTLHAQPLPRH